MADSVLVVIQALPYWEGGEKIIAVYRDDPAGKKAAEAAANIVRKLSGEDIEVRIEAHSIEAAE